MGGGEIVIKIPIKIHICAKIYAAGNNTCKMIKKKTEKDKNVQKVAQGLNRSTINLVSVT